MDAVRLSFSGVSLASREPPEQGMSLLALLWVCQVVTWVRICHQCLEICRGQYPPAKENCAADGRNQGLNCS